MASLLLMPLLVDAGRSCHAEMRKKHRIILILVVGALVGCLVITASLPRKDGAWSDETPWDRASMAGKRILIKLGLLSPQNAARNACIANLKQIDGAKATWALEQKTNNPVPTEFSQARHTNVPSKP
jgi:hypothetical protein